MPSSLTSKQNCLFLNSMRILFRCFSLNNFFSVQKILWCEICCYPWMLSIVKNIFDILYWQTVTIKIAPFVDFSLYLVHRIRVKVNNKLYCEIKRIWWGYTFSICRLEKQNFAWRTGKPYYISLYFSMLFYVIKIS